MATVAELEVTLDAKDRGVEAMLKRLDAALKEVDGSDVDINVPAIDKGPFEDLEALKALIADIDGKRAEADVNVAVATSEATAAFAMVNEEVAKLEKEVANVKVDTDTTEVTTKIEMIDAMLAELDARRVEFDIDIDVAGSIAKLEALKLQLRSVGEAVDDTNDKDVADLDRAFQKLSTVAQRTSVNISGMTAAVLSIGPALIPIAAAGAAGMGALGAAGMAAGAAMTAFGFMAINSLTPVADALTKAKTLQDQFDQAITDKQKETALLKLQQLYASLEPGQLAVVKGVQALQAQWTALTATIRPEIYMMAAEALGAISKALPALKPLIESSVTAFHNLQSASLAALGGPVWQEFFSNISSSAAPAMESLGRSIGNLITGLAGVFNAFFPYQGAFLGGLESITKAFEKWGTGLGDSPQFRAFMAYMQANLPGIGQMLLSVSKAFIAIVEEAAPLGGAVIKNVTALADAITRLHEASPGTLGATIAVAGFLAVLANVAGPLLNLIQLIMNASAMWGALSEVITAATAGISGATVAAFGALALAIVAVIAALVAAYQYIQPFQDAVNQMGAAFMGVAQQIGTALAGALAVVVAWGQEMIAKVTAWAQANSQVLSAAWATVTSFVTDALTGMATAVTAGLGVITQTFSGVWQGLGVIVGAAWDIISGLVEGAIDVILGIILAFAGVITGDWSAVWDGMKQVVSGFGKGLLAIVQGIIEAVLGIIGAAESLLVAAFKLIWDGCAKATQSALLLLKDIAGGALDGVVDKILSFGKMFYDAGSKIISQLAAGIKSEIDSAVAAVKSGVDRMASYLPGSPAEVGPLSGHGYVKLRGQRFMEDLSIGLGDTAGLEQRIAAISSMLAVNPTVTMPSSASMAKAYSAVDGGGGNTYVTVASGAVAVDARGGSDPAAMSAAASTATAELAQQIRIAIGKR